MMRRVLVLLVVALFAVIFARVAGGYRELEGLRPLAEYYVVRTPIDLGIPNVVTGILISYRGFDTLGEVAVLFMVAASVGLLLKAPAEAAEAAAPKLPSEVVQNGVAVLLPLILAFGAYVIVNGHLSAGGGFQGGAIAASAGMLMMLGWPGSKLNTVALSLIESSAGVIYVGVGVLGWVLAGGFLDSRFLPLGQFGAFFSGGAVPVISALLGIKVAAEFSVILERFRS